MMQAVSSIRLTRCTSSSTKLARLIACMLYGYVSASAAPTILQASMHCRPAAVMSIQDIRPALQLEYKQAHYCMLSQPHRNVETTAGERSHWSASQFAFVNCCHTTSPGLLTAALRFCTAVSDVIDRPEKDSRSRW